MRLLRTIIAFIYAVMPFVAFAFIAVLIVVQISSPWRVFFSLVALGVGIYASNSIFNMMRKRGILTVLSEINASSDLEIDHSNEKGVFKYEAKEFALKFQENELKFREGTISIWGDWDGRGLNVKHKIKSIDFESNSEVLTVSFYDDCFLKIKRPKLIYCTKSYIKIVKAKEVFWQTQFELGIKKHYSYLHVGDRIKTKSNTNWSPHKYDLGIGENAIYMQG